MKERQSNIELYRIVLTIGVIILHYNNEHGGAGFKNVTPNSFNYIVLMLLEAFFICAVNGFVIISGYFLSGTDRRKIGKAFDLIIQVMLFSFLFYFARVVAKKTSFSIVGLLVALIPANWFVVIYVALYLLSPLVNQCLKEIYKRTRFWLLMILILFCVYPTIIDLCGQLFDIELLGTSTISINGSLSGYSIIQFIVCYIIGAVIREKEIAQRVDVKKLFVVFIGIGIVIFLWSLWDNSTAWEYCNPFVLLEAIVLFLLFIKIKIRSNSIINALSSASFMVYIIHAFLIPHMKTERFVNSPLMFVHLISVVVLIYLCGCVVHWGYTRIFKRFLQRLNSFGAY